VSTLAGPSATFTFTVAVVEKFASVKSNVYVPGRMLANT
jgi:hypothetical protein